MTRLDVYEGGEKFQRNFDHILPEPDSWPDVIERMPKTPRELPKIEMIVVYRRRLYPFSDSMPRRFGRLANTEFAEMLGLSRAWKTRLSNRVKRSFDSRQVPTDLVRERPYNLRADADPRHFNYMMALNAALQLTDRTQAYSRGGYFKRIPKICLLDRSVTSAEIFDRIYRQFDMGEPLVGILARKHAPSLGLILHMDITPATSKARGSTLSEQMQQELATEHRRLPDTVAEIMGDSYKPTVVARIDASGPIASVTRAVKQVFRTYVEAMTQ